MKKLHYNDEHFHEFHDLGIKDMIKAEASKLARDSKQGEYFIYYTWGTLQEIFSAAPECVMKKVLTPGRSISVALGDDLNLRNLNWTITLLPSEIVTWGTDGEGFILRFEEERREREFERTEILTKDFWEPAPLVEYLALEFAKHVAGRRFWSKTAAQALIQ